MPQETCEVKLKRGENVDRALRRLKKALDKWTGILFKSIFFGLL